MALISWENVCTPRTEGGLAIKQLGAWNKAACGKLLWKILANPECLGAKWAKASYLKEECLWNAKARKDDPWSWRKVLKIRDNFAQHIKVILGDGRQASLFYDNWLPNGAIGPRLDCDLAIWGDNLSVKQWINNNGN